MAKKGQGKNLGNIFSLRKAFAWLADLIKQMFAKLSGKGWEKEAAEKSEQVQAKKTKMAATSDHFEEEIQKNEQSLEQARSEFVKSQEAFKDTLEKTKGSGENLADEQQPAEGMEKKGEGDEQGLSEKNQDAKNDTAAQIKSPEVPTSIKQWSNAFEIDVIPVGLFQDGFGHSVSPLDLRTWQQLERMQPEQDWQDSILDILPKDGVSEDSKQELASILFEVVIAKHFNTIKDNAIDGAHFDKSIIHAWSVACKSADSLVSDSHEIDKAISQRDSLGLVESLTNQIDIVFEEAKDLDEKDIESIHNNGIAWLGHNSPLYKKAVSEQNLLIKVVTQYEAKPDQPVSSMKTETFGDEVTDHVHEDEPMGSSGFGQQVENESNKPNDIANTTTDVSNDSTERAPTAGPGPA